MSKRDVLPLSLPPRGLSRIETAAYIGVSVRKFDAMVADGRMPAPKKVDGRNVWDRLAVDEAFTKLPTSGEPAPHNDHDPSGKAKSWDDVA